MRKQIVAGNWKMNKSFTEAVDLSNSIAKKLAENPLKQGIDKVLVVLASPFPYLPSIKTVVNSNPQIKVASQNCHNEEKGAFTGEVSAPMLASCGVEYVIIGHSERRSLFAESNAFLAMKMDAVLKNNLTPIFCCGEVLEERQTNKHFEVIEKQLNESIFHLSETEFAKIVIAYEPVWAIGTGLTASPEQAQEIHAFIRGLIAKKYNATSADNMTILYGGSCNAKNAKELFSNPDVDGGLIGGASLIADDFITIIRSLKGE